MMRDIFEINAETRKTISQTIKFRMNQISKLIVQQLEELQLVDICLRNRLYSIVDTSIILTSILIIQVNFCVTKFLLQKNLIQIKKSQPREWEQFSV